MQSAYSRFYKYSWFLVAYNMFVIMWGAFVRATGSGAGCGNHWPTCNGEVIPQPRDIEQLIEFSHRLTSAFDGVLVIILVIWAFRLKPVNRAIRWFASLSLIFILIEGGLGAALVRLELVADNDSSLRAFMVGIHLLNTLVLLAWLTLTAWASGKTQEVKLNRAGIVRVLFVIAIIAFGIMSAAGAVTALGDTLFKSESLASGIAQDFHPEAHFLVRLRIWHPVIAILTSIYLVAMGVYLKRIIQSEPLSDKINWLFMVIGIQIAGGFLNVALLAPVWMQMVHLLLADTLWIMLMVVMAESLNTAPNKVKADSIVA